MSDNIDRKLWDAAEAGNEALVSQLIDQATVDWRAAAGAGHWTALHMAAYEGHTPVVTRLLDAGWSLEARSVSGMTPLSLAAVRGQLETVKCLVLRGANMDTQDNYKDTPLHDASSYGHSEVIKTLLQCGAIQQIRNIQGKTAEDVSKDGETRAVFREFSSKELNTKEDLFNEAISEENYEVVIILIIRGANFDGLSRTKLDQITKETKFLDEDHVRVLVSRGSDLAEIPYKKLISILKIMTDIPAIREAIERHFILNIEEKEEDSGNTLLHVVAETNNEKVLKFLLNNGASATQFTKNNVSKIPLEISRNKKNMFQLILLDFLNYALKSPKFPSNEFQNELGSGYKLFCLKRQFDGNKTLLEFLSDQGMLKEREEVIQLLIKIDHFRYKDSKDRSKSKRRIIKILRAGMKPSRGLKEAIDSVKGKYAWDTTKIASKCLLSVAHNILFGWFLYASDIASDVYFYSGLDEEDAKTATLIHIILPFVSSLFLFFTMLYAGGAQKVTDLQKRCSRQRGRKRFSQI